MTDTDFVCAKLQALIGDQQPRRVLTVVHEEPPVTWQRPRWDPKTRRCFTAKRARAGERSLAWAMGRAMRAPGQPLIQFPDTVALFAVFFLPNLRVRDTDNLVKLVMDAGTKAQLWHDDVQVVTHGVLIDLDRHRPRTVLAVCPFLSAQSTAPLLSDTERIVPA